jgi:hypothetical protein
MDLRLARGAAVAAAAIALGLPGSADADDVTCATLQTALNNAGISTIHITEASCPAMQLTIPAGRSVTLTGAPTTFTGNVTGHPVIDAEAALGTTTFSDLTFRDATLNMGRPAVFINSGPATTFERVQFLGDTRTGGAEEAPAGLEVDSDTGSPATVVVRDSVFGTTVLSEGNTTNAQTAGFSSDLDSSTGTTSALTVAGTTFAGNSARTSAALSGVVGGSITVTGSTFDSNTSTDSAGAAFLAADHMTLSGNRFTGNSIVDPSATIGLDQGGALMVSGRTAFGVIQQSGNLFQGNSTQGVAGDPGRFEGGAELARQADITLRGDRFIGNKVDGPTSAAENAGGGFFDDECATLSKQIQAYDVVVAGNSITTGGEGAGIYVGCGDMAPRTLQLFDSTVSGNSVGSGGSSGVAGDTGDTLVLRNTIVAGNTGGPNVDGFGASDAQFSDACGETGAALPGAGNLCADPLLANAAAGDITETPGSPTRDHGSTVLVPADLTTDVFGAPRIQGSAVDIGAAEFPAPAAAGDTTAPSITGFGMSFRRFRVGVKSTPVSARMSVRPTPKGTRFTWISSEPGTAKLRIQRALPGRKVKRKGKTVCAKPRRSLRKHKKCTRFSRGVTLTRHAKTGLNALKFTGRVKKKALKPGHYRASLTETDAAGNRSRTRHLSFRIVKR